MTMEVSLCRRSLNPSATLDSRQRQGRTDQDDQQNPLESEIRSRKHS